MFTKLIEVVKVSDKKSNYLIHFMKIGKQVKNWHLLVLAPTLLIPPMIPGHKQMPLNLFLRGFRALKLSDVLNVGLQSSPPIELLTVVEGKDLEMLGMVLGAALTNSTNPISKIVVITTAKDHEKCKKLLSGLAFESITEVKNEDDVVPLELRSSLKNKFGTRYGWVLQQVLAFDYVHNSQAAGVLLVNTDTVIVSEAQWLNEQGEQILMASLEYNPPYYQFLNTIASFSKKPKWTFVTHHMLFQPEKLRVICQKIGISQADDLINKILEFADTTTMSSICVEFELYAQGMLRFFPELVQLTKFSNTSMKRIESNLSQIREAQLNNAKKEYHSYSLHDYI